MWAVGYRLPALGPYCGSGFLTTDGIAWEHSRALLTPSFLRSNISDHTDFARYLDMMIDKIPIDGSPVDFQTLLFGLYLDTATLWLFGESFESLSGAGAEADAFIHSFGDSLGVGGFRMVLGPLQFFHRSSKWHASNRANQAFIEKYVDVIAITPKTWRCQIFHHFALKRDFHKDIYMLPAVRSQKIYRLACPGILRFSLVRRTHNLVSIPHAEPSTSGRRMQPENKCSLMEMDIMIGWDEQEHSSPKLAKCRSAVIM
jgi:hypothetical protein